MQCGEDRGGLVRPLKDDNPWLFLVWLHAMVLLGASQRTGAGGSGIKVCTCMGARKRDRAVLVLLFALVFFYLLLFFSLLFPCHVFINV